MSKRLSVCIIILIVVALTAGCFPFPKKYTLHVTINGEGTVTPANGKYKAGTSLTLTATPEVNWRFENWGGDAFGHRSTVTIVMDANMEIFAHFVPSQYSLQTSVQGEGTVEKTVVTRSKELIDNGEAVQLKAIPAPGWHFKEWRGDLTGSLNPAIITMDKDYTVTAVFTPNTAMAKWNFLVYMDGDNSLEQAAIADINEMEEIGSTQDMNLLVLIDRTPHYDTSNGDWTGTRLYRITKDNNHSDEIVSELVHDYGELDVSDPAVLKDFLLFCDNAYPAERTAVTLWDHGDGVYPKNMNRNTGPGPLNPQGICWDDTTGTGPWFCLTTDEIAGVLEDYQQVTGHKLDIINMDACLMQTLEVAYEWRNGVDYLIGSQADVPGGGNHYTTLLQVLKNNPSLSTQSFAETFVDDYYTYYTAHGEGTETYSALRLGTGFDSLTAAFQDLATALNLTDDLNGVYKAWRMTTHFTVREYDDLYSLAGNLIQYSQDANVVSKATALRNTFGNVVIRHRETAGFAGKAFGLSILLAGADEWDNYAEANQYSSLLLSVDSDWDEFILRFVEYTESNQSGLLLHADISWPSGNCDLGILEPDENFYWVDQGASPNGTFSQDMQNGGTESWTLKTNYTPGVYTPLVYSHDYTGTVNMTMTLNGGIFNTAIEVEAGYGYTIENVQVNHVNGIPKLSYTVRKKSMHM